MTPLPIEDQHHLNAAEGWLELGNPLEASEELEKVTPSLRAHPAVLILRWNIYAMAKNWEACIDLAKTLTQLVPDREQGWIHLGNSLYFSGRTQEAYDCVKPVLDRFPQTPALPYNLACYACQLGILEEARSLLEKALALDAGQKLKLMAFEDPDLEPLWAISRKHEPS